jgi:hypothetical protein
MPWHPCGCCTYCPTCEGGAAPGQWLVEIDGIAAAVPVNCGNCPDLNAAYVVDKGGTTVPGDFGGCGWEYELETPICNVARVRLTVSLYSFVPVVYMVMVLLLDADGHILAAAKKTYASAAPNCIEMVQEDLGPLTYYVVSLGCNVAVSSVKVTAIRPCYHLPDRFDPGSFDSEAFE